MNEIFILFLYSKNRDICLDIIYQIYNFYYLCDLNESIWVTGDKKLIKKEMNKNYTNLLEYNNENLSKDEFINKILDYSEQLGNIVKINNKNLVLEIRMNDNYILPYPFTLLHVIDYNTKYYLNNIFFWDWNTLDRIQINITNNNNEYLLSLFKNDKLVGHIKKIKINTYRRVINIGYTNNNDDDNLLYQYGDTFIIGDALIRALQKCLLKTDELEICTLDNYCPRLNLDHWENTSHPTFLSNINKDKVLNIDNTERPSIIIEKIIKLSQKFKNIEIIYDIV